MRARELTQLKRTYHNKHNLTTRRGVCAHHYETNMEYVHALRRIQWQN